MHYSQVRTYPPKEEFWNVVTHGIGFMLSLVALVLLVVFASLYKTTWHVISFSIYGASLVILYFASTAYHSSKRPSLRARLNIFDHAAIFLLIAGTYTPYTLVTLRGPWGWSIFGVIWGLAIIGIILKLFTTGRYDRISTIAYVGMGWIAVVAIYPLLQNLPLAGILWMFAGGIFYTVGAIFYRLNRLPYNHAIFHVFVLLGSASHFISIFCYV